MARAGGVACAHASEEPVRALVQRVSQAAVDVEGERARAGTLLAGMRYLFHDRWLRTVSFGVAVIGMFAFSRRDV